MSLGTQPEGGYVGAVFSRVFYPVGVLCLFSIFHSGYGSTAYGISPENVSLDNESCC